MGSTSRPPGASGVGCTAVMVERVYERDASPLGRDSGAAPQLGNWLRTNFTWM